ncbi:MAG: hypothetical protein ACOZHQ_09490 [Thermodesulfobacteriota bacterium]
MLTRDEYDELLEACFGVNPWEDQFRALHQAYLDGLEELAATKAPINGSWGNDDFAAGVGTAGAAPAPGHDYLWVNTDNGQTERRDGTGALASTLVSDRAPRALAGLLADEQLPAENDPALGAVRFANAGAWAWGHFEAWLDGVAWRVVLEAMMSTAESAQVDLNLAYQVFGPDDAMNPVKTRWQASTAYTLGQQRIPTTPNGHYYQCTTAGTSGASEPTWPSTGTVSDGSVVWTRQGAGFKNLALAVTPPSAAHDRFDIDSSSLQIPAEEVSAGDRVHFGLWRSADDTHGGDLIVNELWIAPVEV